MIRRVDLQQEDGVQEMEYPWWKEIIYFTLLFGTLLALLGVTFPFFAPDGASNYKLGWPSARGWRTIFGSIAYVLLFVVLVQAFVLEPPDLDIFS